MFYGLGAFYLLLRLLQFKISCHTTLRTRSDLLGHKKLKSKRTICIHLQQIFPSKPTRGDYVTKSGKDEGEDLMGGKAPTKWKRKRK